MERIRTTHTGSLPRPPALVELLRQREEGLPAPEIDDRVEEAVVEALARQVETGIDVVNDGEQGKAAYSTYVKDRLTGFEGELTKTRFYPDQRRFPDFAELAAALDARSNQRRETPLCNGPVKLKDPDAVHRDIALVKKAAARLSIGEDRLFLTSASPGVIALFFATDFYESRDDYLAALVEAMRPEYRAIVEAGLLLQLDCPDFAMARHSAGDEPMAVEEFRRYLGQSVEALNTAVEGLDPSRIRLHLCWSNTESPHVFDVELHDIIDLVLGASPHGIVLEASNPRHGHEWKVFEDVVLPEETYLVAGVIDTTTNFVEHPELVAQRIGNFVGVLGPERVMAGTDCGFGTFAGRMRVAPSVVWEKLRSLVEGARLASAGD